MDIIIGDRNLLTSPHIIAIFDMFLSAMAVPDRSAVAIAAVAASLAMMNSYL
jgi:hypothetical protein